MMFDTDVIIWFFRGNTKAKEVLHKADGITISAITLMELIQGIRNKQELSTLNQFLSAYAIKVRYVNEEINLHAIHLLEDHTLADGIELADALIAATALHYGEEVLTANVKHYHRLPNMTLHKFNP